MSSREQRKYLDTLKRYEKKFERDELDDYKMFTKRHKDEEELDSLSLNKLKILYEKYYINREKRDVEKFFNKPESNP